MFEPGSDYKLLHSLAILAAVALLAVSSYHACAPVNSTCTAGELFDDARRLGAKAVLTTPEAADRLELSRLRDELRCEVVFLHPRADGPAGLFDLSVMGYGASVDAFVEKPSAVSQSWFRYMLLKCVSRADASA